ncbi:MAG: hypothetical protein FJX72_18975 [Armatimonadetes bacterium]|nr:hypothetical protein [Armatimonadota bacterium]
MTIAVLLAAVAIGPTAAPRPPVFGAIRWDGWFAGAPWERNLQDAAWRDRLPFYAVTTDGKVEVRSDRAETMDREIAYAVQAGLGYWAFCWYHPQSWPEADKYNYGIGLYQASRQKRSLKHAFILQGGHLGKKDGWPDTVRLLVEAMRRRDYQRVLRSRPLLYVFTCEAIETTFGSKEAGREALVMLRAECRRQKAGDPYIVAQVFSAEDGVKWLDAYGFEGIGAYSAPDWGEHRERPYADLARSNRAYRERFAATGRPIVPLLNAGWDGRPRLGMKDYGFYANGPWYAQPTPEEFAEAAREMRDWLSANPSSAPAQTALIYAWNETDEGGWLVPTNTEGDARIRRLGEALRER